MTGKKLVVAVVGPCTSGKSTLVEALREAGYTARHIAQEHSYVPDMWQRFRQSDVLIYLDVQIEAARQRRQISWGEERLDTQRSRLAHARQHADLYVDTTSMTAREVLLTVLSLLGKLESG